MENVEERLGKAETDIVKIGTTVDEHSRLLNLQADKNETLTRLTTIIERQIEDAKKQAKQLERFGEVLSNVNENLTNLNNQQQQLSERVTDIETNLNEAKNDKKDTWKFILSNAITFIMSVLLAYLLFKLGLNNGNLM